MTLPQPVATLITAGRLEQVPPDRAGALVRAAEVDEKDESPDDLIARAEADARAVLAAELLQRIRSIHYTDFERLVLKLLAAMGYGGLGEHFHTGQSNDKGLDGIVTEDKLGLDRIYVQAKRYGDGNAVSPRRWR